MGEAKRRRAVAGPTVYHHTSTLKTNLIWMSGVIRVEGQHGITLHPELGRIETDPSLRRAMRDFPPLAWFASSVVVPRCLMRSLLILKDKKTGERRTILAEEGVMHALALNRVALGFPAAQVPVVPWPEHPGYRTREGGELNESARDVGDDPDTWWVSDRPVDVMQASELYVSRKIMAPKLFRSDASLLADVKRMVALCRSQPGVFIPPTWLATDQAQQLARSLNLPLAPLPDKVA